MNDCRDLKVKYWCKNCKSFITNLQCIDWIKEGVASVPYHHCWGVHQGETMALEVKFEDEEIALD